MKIGICSTDFEPATIDKLFRKVSSFGFNALQFSYVSIGMDEIPEKISSETIEQLKAASKKYDVEIVAVNATFNLIDYDKERLKRNIKNVEVLCKANKMLGCKLLTLCTGSRSHENMWNWHKDNSTREAWDEMTENMGRVVDIARKYDMYLGIEIEANNVVTTPELARKLIDNVGYDKLKVIIDCANLFWAGKAYSKNAKQTIQNAFDIIGNDIILAHGKDIAESDGIEFAPTGKGIVDYDLFINLLKKYGYTDAMVIHGIYSEELMDDCVAFIRKKIEEHNV